MKKILVNILKRIGIYNFLLQQKRKLDRQKFEQAEKRNALRRRPFYSQFVSAGDLVFDVGANVGNRVQVFLEIGCKVVAVEPQQECINELRKKFGNSIEIVEKGLGENEEQKTLYISDTSTISSLSEEWINSVKESRFSRHQWNKTVQIELTTMEALISKYGLPKFCKIDVEGYELDVLKGLKQTVPSISLEYTVPEQTTKLLECIEYCNRLNPAYTYNYAAGEEMELQLKTFCSYSEFKKLVQDKTFQDTGFGDIYISIRPF